MKEDRKAFYIRHKDGLFSYLVRLTGNYHLSGDIMQESFIRYDEHYGDREGNTTLLYTIARNAAYDYFRKERKNETLETDRADNSHNPEQEMMVREEYHRVLSALAALEREERDLIAMVIDGDLSYRDIAAITDTSETNVKVKVHRARIKLRKVLQAGEI